MRGTVRSRGPGRWQVQAYAGRDPRTGARRFRAATVHGTEADADRRLRQLIDEVEASRETTGDDLTMAELLARWQTYRGPDWSPAYRVEVRRILELHALPVIGDQLVRRVRPADLDALYAEARAKGLGASRVATLHRRLHTALGQAVRWDLIATNPAERSSRPQPPRSKAQAATSAQVATVLQLADEEPDLAAFVRLTAVTGARRGEVCALRWDDVDLEAGEVTFEHGLSDGGPGVGVVVKGTKTDRPKRLALGAGTVEVLRTLRAAHLEVDLAEGARSPWVFPAPIDRSRPVRPDRMSKRWAALRDRAGHPGLRLHDLRHGVGTGGMEAGYTPMEVAARLGHARPSTTTDLYGHHAPARDRRLADELGARLDEAIEEAG